MRVVAGSLRGRTIVAPLGESTRPTTDRARQATFNALESLGAVEDSTVLDLFAGSGALGIEALSRGASSCTFVERDRTALEAIRHNVSRLGVADRAKVVAGDVLTSLPAQHGFDLVLADPPYGYAGWERLFDSVARVLSADGVLVVEADREFADLEGWDTIRSKRYGRAWISFLRRSEADRVS